MILVTGATGNLGKATIDFLLKKGAAPESIIALVRDAAKAADLAASGVTVKIGDYNDYASLVAAFAGVDKLLLVSGNDIENRSKQQIDVVNAAKEAGVKHILYTSFERKNETATSPIAIIAGSHLATEKAIIESGLKYTLFRNNLYFDVLPMFLGEHVLETGIFFPAGDGKTAFALRNDMAEAIANVLLSEGHEDKNYYISNTENISIADVAAALSELSGKTIAYNSPSQEVYTETLTNAGVPTEYIQLFAGFAEGIKQGEFATDKTDLEALLGRKPTSINTFLAQVYASKN